MPRFFGKNWQNGPMISFRNRAEARVDVPGRHRDRAVEMKGRTGEGMVLSETFCWMKCEGREDSSGA